MQISRTDMEALASMIAKEVVGNILAKTTPGRWMTIEEAKEYATRSGHEIRSGNGLTTVIFTPSSGPGNGLSTGNL